MYALTFHLFSNIQKFCLFACLLVFWCSQIYLSFPPWFELLWCLCVKAKLCNTFLCKVLRITLDSIYSRETWLHLQWMKESSRKWIKHKKTQGVLLKYNSLMSCSTGLMIFKLFRFYIKLLSPDYIIMLNILWKAEF